MKNRYLSRKRPPIRTIILFVIILILFPWTVFATCTSTSDFACVTCTQGEAGDCRQPVDLTVAKIQAAINASANGDGTRYQDGVYLISGSKTWDGGITLNKKGLVLKGAGSSSTVITSGAFAAITLGSYPNYSRVTGIGFVGSSGSSYALVGNAQNIRIDNCSFTGTWATTIRFYDGYHNTGVIHNNTFNANISGDVLHVMDTGSSSVSTFATAIDFGSADWMFFEGNTVNSTNNFNEMIESQNGGKIVSRWNTFTGVWGVVWEQHNTNTHSNVGVGGRAHDAYNNLMRPTPDSYNAILTARDGTGVFHNNVYDMSLGETERQYALNNYRAASWCATSSFTDVAAPEYGANCLARCCAATYTNGAFQGEGYPCVGTVYGVRGGNPEPYYFWDNKKTSNGTTMVNATNIGVPESTEQWALQENREWCVSNSGKPESCNGHTLTYTPYQCPHPLTGLSGKCNNSVVGAAGYPIEVEAPTNLHIKY